MKSKGSGLQREANGITWTAIINSSLLPEFKLHTKQESSIPYFATISFISISPISISQQRGLHRDYITTKRVFLETS